MEFLLFINFVILIVIFISLKSNSRGIRDLLQEVRMLKIVNRPPVKTESVEKIPVVSSSSTAIAILDAEQKDAEAVCHKVLSTKSELKVEIEEVPPPPLPKNIRGVLSEAEPLIAQPEPKPLIKPEVKDSRKITAEDKLPSWADKMWNWFLVGKEHRPAGMQMEFAVASIWMLRVAVVALVMGMGFFLNMTSDQPFLGGDVGRITLAFFVGSGMLGAGLFLLGKKFNLNGEGLVGGGLLIFYFCCYAAGPRYGLIDTVWAFSLMAVITVASGVISVKVNSLMIAAIGLAGGYAAPHMLPTDAEQLPLLYSYIILLSIGVWLVVRVRPWQILLYTSFVCSYLLVIGSLSKTTPDMLGMVMGFVTVIFAIYATMVYVHNIHNEKQASLPELLHVVINALVYAGIGYWLIDRSYPQEFVAVLSMSLAAFYIAQVWFFLQFKVKQRELFMVLIALSAGFTVWTLPLLLKNGSLTVGFAILAFMFLWLGQKLKNQFLQNLSYVLYFFTFARLLVIDLHRSYGHGLTGLSGGFLKYLKVALSRLMTFGVPAVSTLAGNYLLRKPRAVLEIAVEGEKDGLKVPEQPLLGTIFQWTTALLIFVFMLFEFNDFLSDSVAWNLPILTLIWCLMAGYCLFRFLQEEFIRPVIAVTVIFFVVGSVIKLLVYDTLHYGLDGVLYAAPYTLWDCFSRFMDFSFVIALLFVGAWGLRGKHSNLNAAPFLGYGGLALLLLYQTLEIQSLLAWKLPEFIQGGTSVLWAVNAIVYIIIGMIKKQCNLRFIGLGMFVIIVIKVFLVDLQDMLRIYRVIALIIVGVIMMIGSFIYVFSSGKFSITSEIDNDAD